MRTLHVRDEYFLVILIVALRVADGVISYLPAKGLVLGLAEANPVTSLAIQRYGVFWAFVLLTMISLAFLGFFLAGTYLEEVRRADKADYGGVRKIKQVRLAGLVCIAALAAFPLLNNLAIALRL